jgi:hypothetical protein
MVYPAKFRTLLELELKDVEAPDYAWLTYAVCGTTEDACSWNGWMLEGAFKKNGKRYPTATGDKSLRTIGDDQGCPVCGRKLFRTGATLRFEPSADQKPIHGEPGVDYETSPMEYE